MRQRKIFQVPNGCAFSNRFAAASMPALMVLCVAVAVRSQETPGNVAVRTPSNPEVRSAGPQANSHYVVGIGDVLDIRVFGRPQLTRDAVRVDARGKIRMPLLENEIQALCRTEAGLAADIATQYLKYVRRPQVDVFIREYNSQPVAAVGAVIQPEPV